MRRNHQALEEMKKLKTVMTNEEVETMNIVQSIIDKKSKKLNDESSLDWDNYKIFEATIYAMNDEVCYIILSVGKFETNFYTVSITSDKYEYIQETSSDTLIADEILDYFLWREIINAR